MLQSAVKSIVTLERAAQCAVPLCEDVEPAVVCDDTAERGP
jgi:hypothetical protein